MVLRDLKINQVPFWYQTYEGEQEIIDYEGALTGEKELIYSDPVKAMARISPNTQDAQTMPWGVELAYDKAISTVQDLPIDEYSKLFIDVEPQYDFNGKLTNEADYEVVRVAKDLQQKVWAVKKIENANSKPAEFQEYQESDFGTW